MSEFSSEKTRQSADVEHGPVRQRQPAAVLQDNRASAIQAKTAESAPNNTGLPAQLKAGIESLSGMNMDHVNVHYNSSKPAQLQAHAYAQGSEIHLAPGQEKHLPHEAWHVVQQAQGRVKPTMQMKGGVRVNDDGGLEREADVMGGRATVRVSREDLQRRALSSDMPLASTHFVAQRKVDVVQLGEKSVRRNPKRLVRVEERELRNGPERVKRRIFFKKLALTKLARKNFKATSPYRTALKLAKKLYAGYPKGSYANGRYLYLSNKLKAMGGVTKSQIDFRFAPVEIDHSPHDGSQRTGKRVQDDASNYRVAVPLPRSWHRNHKTTHGPGANRHDSAFVQSQKGLVQSGQYAEALKHHLLDTLHSDAVGQNGEKKVALVLLHMGDAINYAAGNDIKVSIHKHHKKGTPAISGSEHGAIKDALRQRVNDLKSEKNLHTLLNPF